jgi:hypothetical protein
VQGYNAQAVTTCEHVIVAAELTQQASDLQQLEPMLAATTATLAAAGIAERPGTLLADPGYWTIANLTAIPDAPELLVPPAKHGRQGKPRKDGRPSDSKSDGLRAAMTAKLLNPDFGLPADQLDPVGHRAVQDRERGLALGTRTAVALQRQGDGPPAWREGQLAGRARPATRLARTRQEPERTGPER